MRAERNHMATQYTFIVTTKPASKASQFNPSTSLGAAKSIATVKAILTISQTKNPTSAAFPCVADFCRESPRANNAAGITTASAP